MSYRTIKGVQTKDAEFLNPGTLIEDVSVFDQPDRLIEAGFIVPAEDEPAAEPVVEGRGDKVSPTPWVFDPESLQGIDIDQLNVLIAERDESIEPFEDVDEAIDWLSQDYEG